MGCSPLTGRNALCAVTAVLLLALAACGKNPDAPSPAPLPAEPGSRTAAPPPAARGTGRAHAHRPEAPAAKPVADKRDGQPRPGKPPAMKGDGPPQPAGDGGLGAVGPVRQPAAGSAPAARPAVDAPAQATLVQVFYGTDRKPAASGDGPVHYGTQWDDAVNYGTATVSIPAVHKLGGIERPAWWKLEFGEDPARHVILRSVTPIAAADDFFAQLGAATGKSAHKSAFVFVHGYNVGFEDAALRTAQIAYDLQLRVTPIFYSWPSRHEVADYPADENTVEWSKVNLKAFLADVAQRSGAEQLYVIAHSMGTRAASQALVALLNERPELQGRYTQVILAAPDIDAAIFKRDIAPVFDAHHLPATLYASSRDKALLASGRLHTEPRAGSCCDPVVVARGVETVDASAVDTDFLGHSYFASTRELMADIAGIILDGHDADHRFGIRRDAQAAYWHFVR